MPIDVALFFARDDAVPHSRMQGHGCFIHGARRTGKTSFAFQAAVNIAQNGSRVVMLSHEHSLQSKMPQPFTPLSHLSETELSRIEVVYVETLSDVICEVGGWMTLHDLPAILLVDDDSFSDAGDVRRTALMLSALENLYEWSTRCNRLFHYVFVSNSFPQRSHSSEFPFAAFPLVFFLFGSSGSVMLQSLEVNRLLTSTMRLEWNDGLVLKTHCHATDPVE